MGNPGQPSRPAHSAAGDGAVCAVTVIGQGWHLAGAALCPAGQSYRPFGTPGIRPAGCGLGGHCHRAVVGAMCRPDPGCNTWQRHAPGGEFANQPVAAGLRPGQRALAGDTDFRRTWPGQPVEAVDTRYRLAAPWHRPCRIAGCRGDWHRVERSMASGYFIPGYQRRRAGHPQHRAQGNRLPGGQGQGASIRTGQRAHAIAGRCGAMVELATSDRREPARQGGTGGFLDLRLHQLPAQPALR
ncbi:hypothetical protein D3C85_914520 [compost metagenome]